MFTAFLDACVPVALADTLLRAGEARYSAPRWSTQVIDEAKAALREVHPDLEGSRIDYRFRQMNAAFPEASVSGYGPLTQTIRDLPDADDRHVVAAAWFAQCDVIVTRNVKDFPDEVLQAHGLSVKSPDDFLLDTLDLPHSRLLNALCEQAEAARNPPRDVSDVVIALGRAGVPEFARKVHALLGPQRHK